MGRVEGGGSTWSGWFWLILSMVRLRLLPLVRYKSATSHSLHLSSYVMVCLEE